MIEKIPRNSTGCRASKSGSFLFYNRAPGVGGLADRVNTGRTPRAGLQMNTAPLKSIVRWNFHRRAISQFVRCGGGVWGIIAACRPRAVAMATDGEGRDAQTNGPAREPDAHLYTLAMFGLFFSSREPKLELKLEPEPGPWSRCCWRACRPALMYHSCRDLCTYRRELTRDVRPLIVESFDWIIFLHRTCERKYMHYSITTNPSTNTHTLPKPQKLHKLS